MHYIAQQMRFVNGTCGCASPCIIMKDECKSVKINFIPTQFGVVNSV